MDTSVLRITIVVLYPETRVLLLFYIIHSPVVIFLKSGFTLHALITVNCHIDYLVFNEVIILYSVKQCWPRGGCSQCQSCLLV